MFFFFFFFNDTATTEIYTLSLHDALPIFPLVRFEDLTIDGEPIVVVGEAPRSEEHTSELQSQFHLVCRLLLEKKKKKAARQKHEHSQTDGPRHIHAHQRPDQRTDYSSKLP